MKIRILALASAAFLAMAGSANAGEGIYIGAGVGWSQLNDVDAKVGPPVGRSDTGSFGSAAQIGRAHV